uniref:Uncharacterized protein n=1 Tax=Arundo donax TaxID=35708 RepID=A0A0A8ZNK3_ARUDO
MKLILSGHNISGFRIVLAVLLLSSLL